MIRVDLQPVPNDFDNIIREPGMKFLATTPHPTQAQWKSHDYWSRVKEELYDSYQHVCAYSCHWIPPEGSRTCDHFIPKDRKPTLAYEWKNFRLMCGVLNGRKQNRTDLLDPFRIQDAWFTLEFPSLLVFPNDTLSAYLSKRVQTTINVLKLNDDGTCRATRRHWLRAYCTQGIPIDFLRSMAPFLTKELERQNLVSTIASIMQFK